MQNLAGHPKATAICAVELQQAGVPVELLATSYGEPRSDIGGRLGDFTFRRAWYYWVVRGPMPLAQAQTMYADPVGALDVHSSRISSRDIPNLPRTTTCSSMTLRHTQARQRMSSRTTSTLPRVSCCWHAPLRRYPLPRTRSPMRRVTIDR